MFVNVCRTALRILGRLLLSFLKQFKKMNFSENQQYLHYQIRDGGKTGLEMVIILIRVSSLVT